jgi:hypothetical protein
MSLLAEGVRGIVQREMTDYLRNRDGTLHTSIGLQVYGGETTKTATHTATLTIAPGGAACYDLTMVIESALGGKEVDELREDGWKVPEWTASNTTCTLLYHPPTN